MATQTLEERRQQATKIIAEITNKKHTIQLLLDETSTLLSSVKGTTTTYKTLVEKLNGIRSEVESSFSKIKKDKTRIVKLFHESERFYQEKYAPLAERYAATKKDFAVTTNSANKEFQKIKKLQIDCEKQYKEIIILGKNYQTKINELKKIELIINNFHRSAEKNKSRIDLLCKTIEETYQNIESLHTKIKQFERESSANTNSIRKYVQESRNNNSRINELKNTSQRTLDAIRQIYNIAHETGLSGEFESRRNSLNGEVNKWQNAVFKTSATLFIGILLLFFFQLYLNNFQLDATFDMNFYIRFLIFSPIVYYLYFVSSQYSQAKYLHDRYAFKTTLSMSIKSHIELLTHEGYFKKEEQLNQVLEFVLDSFKNIYSEPSRNSDDYKMKIKLANIEIEMQKKIIKKLSEITTKEALKNNKPLN